jgi:hypothetical protein
MPRKTLIACSIGLGKGIADIDSNVARFYLYDAWHRKELMKETDSRQFGAASHGIDRGQI